MPGWRTLRVNDDEVQVYPVDDLIEHELVEDTCVCGPRSECVPRDGYGDAWMHFHSALDGRELEEAS